MYQELQTQVFNWLKNKYEQDNSFTFSVRQKANKGAELNYFIGTEKSKYFSTTFWNVSVSYPGSSSDLINLVFTINKNKKIEFHFQFNQTKDPQDNQNAYALEFIQSIKPLFREVFPEGYYAPDTNKMEFFAAYSGYIYDNFEGLKNDLELFLGKIFPIVDRQISLFKQKYPEFIAYRFSSDDQEKMFSKMEERFQKYKVLGELTEELEEEEELVMLDPEIDYNVPLNQILYGPPGTGKTYNTINKAISIANPDFNLKQTRAIVKEEYARLVEAGQIVFTTFHQSMSYEDFIEGIKPIMNEGESDLAYEIQNGIFKEICQSAVEINENSVVDNFDESWNQLIESVKEHIAEEKLLKIGSWEYGLSTKESLKYSSLNSPSQYTFTITKQNIKDAYQDKQARPSGAFQKDMIDIVQYMKSHFKLSENQKENANTENSEQIKNYVLIIDEINRGNVSQIFGELITLIEESKRLGNPEELQVTLPYSKEKFGVSSNLYIIGTMNTADRSVEALDTALRRRFSFVEMMPDVNVVTEQEFTDYDRAEIMQRINNRIELLLDRNYTLGHSYFIKEDFKSSFKNEIIPLLQEYFYNDCSKIGLILGKGFVREKEISKFSQKNVFADFDTRNEIDIVKSYELIPFEEVAFDDAIDKLLA
ncbi:McrB family protein [Epilithonimonas sp.]|uniref:McrB family protein n=1 Tax=Epilithonimonas sp. TaxID=2894511 RepID=UPI00289835E5|nr:AAA family ATPase [Epilithonimonas sp.]